MRRYSAVLAVAAMALTLTAVYALAAGVIEANDDTYYNEVVRSDKPVILEFYATWCGACKKVAPEVDKIANELDGKVKVVKMNVDKSRVTSDRFKVRSIPAFFYMEDGNIRGQAVGASSKDELLDELGVDVD